LLPIETFPDGLEFNSLMAVNEGSSSREIAKVINCGIRPRNPEVVDRELDVIFYVREKSVVAKVKAVGV
jgi:hypothetical protein